MFLICFIQYSYESLEKKLWQIRPETGLQHITMLRDNAAAHKSLTFFGVIRQ